MRPNSLLHRLGAVVAVVAVTGAALLTGATAAQAQIDPPPSGGIYFDPTSGIQATVVGGTTAGPCDVGASNALQVYVTGPGPFAPDPNLRPYGVALQGATPIGFSKTGPNTFLSRLPFIDLARELGLSAVPVGDYVVDFRCVDEWYLDVYQTYTGTITFTTPTTFTAPGAPMPTPAPTPVPTPVPMSVPTSVPTPVPNAGADRNSSRHKGGDVADRTALRIMP